MSNDEIYDKVIRSGVYEEGFKVGYNKGFEKACKEGFKIGYRIAYENAYKKVCIGDYKKGLKEALKREIYLELDNDLED
ncbi:hypothetical protein [Methanobrevibacter sp.]|uniref:hypothetical protein n=1 Tax=Methanobrevibacter sp. TaxID=66852 RepID=UPI00388E9BD1